MATAEPSLELLVTPDERTEANVKLHKLVAILRHTQPVSLLDREISRTIITLYEAGQMLEADTVAMLGNMLSRMRLEGVHFLLRENIEKIESMERAKSAPSLDHFISQVTDNRGRGIVRK